MLKTRVREPATAPVYCSISQAALAPERAEPHTKKLKFDFEPKNNLL